MEVEAPGYYRNDEAVAWKCGYQQALDDHLIRVADQKILEFIRDWGACAMDDENAPWKLKQFPRVMIRRGWIKVTKS